MKPSAALIILNWNEKSMSEECIQSLKKTDYPNYKIIFVDNGSKDGSAGYIKNKFKDIDVVANESNLGYPKGMNTGARYARKKYDPDYFVLLNNDTLFPDQQWLTKMIDALETNPSFGIGTPVLTFPDGGLQSIGGRASKILPIGITPTDPKKIKKFFPFEVREIDCFMGVCYVIKKVVIEKIGLLDERYSPFLFEEVEYALRTRRSKFKIITVGSTKIIHLYNVTFRKNIMLDKKKDVFKSYMATRNGFLFSLSYSGIAKTIALTLPIMFVANIFERKNKEKGPAPFNIGFRRSIIKKNLNLFKALSEAWRINRKNKPLPGFEPQIRPT